MKLKPIHLIPVFCGAILILLLSSKAYAQPVYITGPPIAVDLASDPNPKIVDLSAQTGGQPIIFAYLGFASNYGNWAANTNVRIDNDPALSFSGTNLIINWNNLGTTSYYDGTPGPGLTTMHVSWFVVTGNTTMQYEGGSALIPWPASCPWDFTHWATITASRPVIFAYAAVGMDINLTDWGATQLMDVRWGAPTPETISLQIHSFRSFAGGCSYNRYFNWFAFTEP